MRRGCGVEQARYGLSHHADVRKARHNGATGVHRHMRDLARLQLHVEADDAEQHHEHHDGEQQVHCDARQQNDRALPKRQAAVLLPMFAFEQRVRIVDRARLALFVARRLRQARFAGGLDLLFGGDNLHGAVRVVLVFLRGARAAAPFHQLVKRFKRLVVGDAAICSNVFHVRRAAEIQRRKHRLKMRAHLARLHAAHARIAAKQDRRDAELRAPFLEADVRAGHTQHEFGDAHAERTRGQIVAAFVNDHQNAQHDGAIQNHQDNVHRQSSFCLKGSDARRKHAGAQFQSDPL